MTWNTWTGFSGKGAKWRKRPALPAAFSLRPGVLRSATPVRNFSAMLYEFVLHRRVAATTNHDYRIIFA
jgi:hypothetical protein